VFLFVICYTIVVAGARQSTIVHKEMIKRLLYASLGNFYNRVPTGRIVNRLTKDLRELDETIMYSFLYLLISLFELLNTLTICVYTTSPLVVIPMLLIAYLANLLRKYYLRTQMEVSRFEKSTNSPVVSGLLSTISGLPTIRAYNKQTEFADLQYYHFDINKRVRLTKAGLENWFANALALLCFFINMPCIAYCMFSADNDSSVIGLLMTYALYLIFNVSGLVLSEADFETKLVSIERIYKFMEIEPEKKYLDYCKEWEPIEEEAEQVIKAGNIEFRDLKVRYRSDLPDVITGISCSIRAGEKIGIVGRTGAGKTTIINTLLGITEISGGSILLDGSPIEALPMKALRQSLTMIDQEPTLIKSTFKENLDLTSHYTDEELETILKDCNLWEAILEKGGLEGAVSNTSLSAGEKQLLCICRAFLKHSRVVLIDEATANIDVRNDALIQRVIADKFRESTVLTIAHRLSTLQNSDRIMVMEHGRLVEFGPPAELEARAGGVYSEMMRKHQKEMLG
jgi:ATP-binding cassette, subfamily C (CFTR/MRP), member 1